MENMSGRSGEPAAGAYDDYKTSLKRLIKSEVDRMLDEELRQAARQLMEEQRKAIRQAVDEQRQIISEVLEEEKLGIRSKMAELRRSLGRLASV
jgi:hypothetical protein